MPGQGEVQTLFGDQHGALQLGLARSLQDGGLQRSSVLHELETVGADVQDGAHIDLNSRRRAAPSFDGDMGPRPEADPVPTMV